MLCNRELVVTCQWPMPYSSPANVLPTLSSAYCRNALDGHWYSYDDSTVEPVLEDEVSTRAAYILFYQRRSLTPGWSGGSSLRGWL